MNLVIISGSPRHNSVTYRVALHLQQRLLEEGTHSIQLVDIREYSLPPVQDVWNGPDAAPEPLRSLAQTMFAADGFIVVTPEYNGSYSPAMQNLFDHLPKQQHKVFGIATASPGALGGIRAAMQTQQFIYALFGIGSPYMLVTPGVEKKFDAEGNLIDPSFEKSVNLFLKEYLWLAERVVSDRVPA